MTNSPQSGSADLLTRTTLRIEGGISTPSMAHVVHALQRVPGVLLAEIDAASARAIVAHDSAVPTTSLLAAAAGAGVRATIVADRRAPAVSSGIALPLADTPTRRLLMLVAALVFVLPFIGAISPSLAKNHFLLPVLLSFAWAFVIARATFSRPT